ncbi:5-formyltetrahydrofolate cyclo-ligase [Lentisalinibacter sediminis]|uniref:5-formyltetrahydrofolate cyclo-ligase n=1 Tax=Lentisalinibacter sediminis TaxID=2992237 RepID=UPI00386562AB
MQAERARHRQAGQRARLALDDATRARHSAAICRHLSSSPLWHAARRIGLYFAASAEVDVSDLFVQAFVTGRVVYVPVVGDTGLMHFVRLSRDATLVRNRYGIWEPERASDAFPVRQLDLVVTPLAAFDDAGNRIGMGAGYYDRCFSFLRNRRYWLHPKLVGAAFSCQRVSAIHAAAWDIPLFAVATENGMHRFRY